MMQIKVPRHVKEIINNPEFDAEDKIQYLLCEGYDYDDIFEIVLRCEDEEPILC